MEDSVMLKFEGVHTGYGSKEVIKMCIRDSL